MYSARVYAARALGRRVRTRMAAGVAAAIRFYRSFTPNRVALCVWAPARGTVIIEVFPLVPTFRRLMLPVRIASRCSE
jgi:hypothetical protein